MTRPWFPNLSAPMNNSVDFQPVPGEMKKVLQSFLSRVTSRISLVMLTSLPATGGTRRKSRTLQDTGGWSIFRWYWREDERVCVWVGGGSGTWIEKLLDDINGTAACALKHSWNTVAVATLAAAHSPGQVNEPEHHLYWYQKSVRFNTWAFEATLDNTVTVMLKMLIHQFTRKTNRALKSKEFWETLVYYTVNHMGKKNNKTIVLESKTESSRLEIIK